MSFEVAVTLLCFVFFIEMVILFGGDDGENHD